MIKKTKKVAFTGDTGVAKNEKFNIVPWLIVLAAIVLILGIVLIFYIFEDFNYVRKFTFDSATGELTDEKNDITYVMASVRYEPVRISKKPYASDGFSDYYQIGYLDKDGNEQLIPTSRMLATSPDEGSFIFYNPDQQKLPELESFPADSVFVCDLDYNTLDSLDEDETRILKNGILNGEITEVADYDAVFALRLRSEEMPWMSYCLDLYFANDNLYIYDRAEKRTVLLPSNTHTLFDDELLSMFK